MVFQVSKLATLLLKATRRTIGSSGWDVLVPGDAFGQLIQVHVILFILIPASSLPIYFFCDLSMYVSIHIYLPK